MKYSTITSLLLTAISITSVSSLPANTLPEGTPLPTEVIASSSSRVAERDVPEPICTITDPQCTVTVTVWQREAAPTTTTTPPPNAARDVAQKPSTFDEGGVLRGEWAKKRSELEDQDVVKRSELQDMVKRSDLEDALRALPGSMWKDIFNAIPKEVEIVLSSIISLEPTPTPTPTA